METPSQHLNNMLNMSYPSEKDNSKTEVDNEGSFEAKAKALEKDILYWQNKVCSFIHISV